jgi:opacity protein-like surface antigen
VWRRVVSGAVSLCGSVVFLGALLTADSARAADLPPPQLPPPSPAVAAYKAPDPALTGFYIGGALNDTHHTGYVPLSQNSAEQYALGFKVFGGYRFTDNIRFEAAYHYLGKIQFEEDSPIESTEQSWAVSGSAVLMTPELSRWVGPGYVPTYIFLRFGLAYKNINHVSAVGTFNEGVLSGVLGGGFEFRPTNNLFMRMEYEFISTAIGGPNRPVPALNSLFITSFGGTQRAINVMHTPLALTLGVYL